MVRLAEIDIVPEKLEAYMEFAAEVGRVSMATEPGVIALFSMQDKADPCKIYILEVYADRQAYEAHIQTSHFRKYKDGTADMVRSLKLIDTIPLVMADFLKKAL
ncbi:MAG: antibiotic biosynthesis monooxygenase [Bacteroidales bacterium]|nr:antibiotic biosynthesis monooxygenase [Bacteroidales bacterium]